MTLTFLAEQRPFKVTQTISLERDYKFKPATDMRQVQDQNKNSFLATGDEKLYRFTRTNYVWTDKPLVIKLSEYYVRSCLILPSSCVFVAMKKSFSFYSPELEHVKDVELTGLVDGLRECYQFKPLTHSQSGTCIMLAEIKYMKKIEAHNIQYSYTGFYDFVLVEVNLDEKASPPQIQCADIKNKAMILKQIDYHSVVELSKDKLLVDNLVIDKF